MRSDLEIRTLIERRMLEAQTMMNLTKSHLSGHKEKLSTYLKYYNQVACLSSLLDEVDKIIDKSIKELEEENGKGKEETNYGVS